MENLTKKMILKPTSSSSSSSSSLGHDLLIEILVLLPIKSLIRFKCVSKAWYSFISDTSFLKRLPLTTMSGLFNQRGDYVSLVPCKETTSQTIITHLSLSFLPNYPDLTVIQSCNGLVLCAYISYSSHSVLYVCNPVTRKWAALPNSHTGFRSHFFYSALAFDPQISPSFKVVLLKNNHQEPANCLQLEVFSSETGEWVVSKLSRTRPSKCIFILKQAVFANGFIYKLARPYHLARIDFADARCIEIELPARRILRWLSKQCLGLSGGNLYYASYHQNLQLQVWMLKAWDTNEWVLKHNKDIKALMKQHFELFGKIKLLAFHQHLEVIFLGVHNKILSYNFVSMCVEEILGFTQDNLPYHRIYGAFPFAPCLFDSLKEAPK